MPAACGWPTALMRFTQRRWRSLSLNALEPGPRRDELPYRCASCAGTHLSGRAGPAVGHRRDAGARSRRLLGEVWDQVRRSLERVAPAASSNRGAGVTPALRDFRGLE